MEEKHSANETMRRENRRVAAMSWSGASGEQDIAPPKPARPNLTSNAFNILIHFINQTECLNQNLSSHLLT